MGLPRRLTAPRNDNVGASYKYVGQCAYCMEEAFSHPRVGGGAHEVGGGLWNT